MQDITTSKLGAVPLGCRLAEDLVQMPAIPVSSNVTFDKSSGLFNLHDLPYRVKMGRIPPSQDS